MAIILGERTRTICFESELTANLGAKIWNLISEEIEASKYEIRSKVRLKGGGLKSVFLVIAGAMLIR